MFVGGQMQTELNKVVAALQEFYAHETCCSRRISASAR